MSTNKLKTQIFEKINNTFTHKNYIEFYLRDKLYYVNISKENIRRFYCPCVFKKLNGWSIGGFVGINWKNNDSHNEMENTFAILIANYKSLYNLPIITEENLSENCEFWIQNIYNIVNKLPCEVRILENNINSGKIGEKSIENFDFYYEDFEQ